MIKPCKGEFVFARTFGGYNCRGKIVGTVKEGLYDIKSTLKEIVFSKCMYGLCIKEGYYILENLRCTKDSTDECIPIFLSDFLDIDSFNLKGIKDHLYEVPIKNFIIEGNCLSIRLKDYFNLPENLCNLIDSAITYNEFDAYCWLLLDEKTKSLVFIKSTEY